MFILYIEESGVEQLGAGTSHFVLLGLMIPADRWKSLDAALEGTKTRYDLEDVEIHTGWMRRTYVEQESVHGFQAMARDQRRTAAELEIKRRSGVIGVSGNKSKVKAYRREIGKIRPYLHLTKAERVECLEELASQIASWTDVRIFADAISKPDFNPGRRTPYEMAFEQVLTRFQAFLATRSGTGLVVHDNNDTVAPRLTRLARQFHSHGTFYRQITDIVETPLFVDSSLTSMIQMADLCAYALRRLFENGETRLWEILEPRVDQRNGISVGVRHYTGPRPCSCRVCIAHGRPRP